MLMVFQLCVIIWSVFMYTCFSDNYMESFYKLPKVHFDCLSMTWVYLLSFLESGNLYTYFSDNYMKVRKKAKIRNRIPHLTKDSIWGSDKTQEKVNQKAARNRQDSMTDTHRTKITKRIHKRSTALEWSVQNYKRA